MSNTRRLAAIAALAFFCLLNAGTSQPDPAPAAPPTTPGVVPGVGPVAPQVPGAVPSVKYCNRPGEGRCQQVRIDTPLGERAERLGCEQRSGTWSDTPCATTSLLGRCTTSTGQSVWHYYTPNWTANDAQSMCTTLGGTWAVAP